MPRNLFWAISLSAPAALLQAQPAGAAVATPPPRTCSAYSAADVVVVGRVVSEHATDDWDAWTVSVEHRIKGRVPGRFKFYSENDSARATPDVGKTNIFFLHRMGDQILGWGSDPNTGGPELAGITREVRTLAAAKPGPTGSVAGLVATESGVPRTNARVHFRQPRSGVERSVRTDSHGRFELSLPPGRWVAKLADKGWTSRMSLYSYDNPDGFTVKRGGCNDLRLESIKAR